jgi:NAD+ kinase
VARSAGVELVDDGAAEPDVAVVLGGDGTMLRALTRFLGTRVPVIGVNLGRVGFLTSMAADEVDDGLARFFAGEYRVVELPTLVATVDGTRVPAINDVVTASSVPGRMISLSWAVGGEDLGELPCDGVICATPTGSTAYNLSNGGPVLARGLDAMAITFIAPHSLHARPLVVARGAEVVVTNQSASAAATVLVDGHEVGRLEPGEHVSARLNDQSALLATLPETTFFRRYRDVFAH